MDVQHHDTVALYEDDPDVWYNEDKLYHDHIQEVLAKWPQVDEEIWAKIIVFERNRRVAKAYARTPVLTINGTQDGFDGYRIGLNGFDNPLREAKTEELKRHIGHGIKMKMDETGNLIMKRMSKSNVYIKSTNRVNNTIGNDIIKLPNLCLELEKPVKLFDMKKFQANIGRELRSARPDRKRLERQCCSIIAFVKTEENILELPVWVLIINIVALGLLKSKYPALKKRNKSRPYILIPQDDEYDYCDYRDYCDALCGLEKLDLLPAQKYCKEPEPDYDVKSEYYDTCCRKYKCCKDPHCKDFLCGEDPYYCGLRAHVPNYPRRIDAEGSTSSGFYSGTDYFMSHRQREPTPKSDHSIYSQVYGDVPLPTRGFLPQAQPPPIIGDWN